MIYKTKIYALCNTYSLVSTLFLDTETNQLFLSGEAIFEPNEFKFYPKLANKGTSGDNLRVQMNQFVFVNQKLLEDRLDDNGEIYKINHTSLIFIYTSLSHLEGVLAGHQTNRLEGLFLKNVKIPFRKMFPFHGNKISIKNFENAISVSNEELRIHYQVKEQMTQSKSVNKKTIVFNDKVYREHQKLKHENYAKKINFNKELCVMSYIIEKREDKAQRASHILDQKLCTSDAYKANPKNGLYLSLNADNWIDQKKISFDLDKKLILVKEAEQDLITKISLLSQEDKSKLFHYIEENSQKSFWKTRNAHMENNNHYIKFTLF